MIKVIIRSPTKLIFEGTAESVIMPGEYGVFETLTFHKRLISRLLKGSIDVDGRLFPIQRGIAKVDRDSVTVIAEQ